MLDFFADLGTSIVRLALLIGWMAGSAWFGLKFAKERPSEFLRPPWYHNWLAWVMGILAAVVLGLIIYPTIELLENQLCRNADDFEECKESFGESDY